jgi:hypothetical protein
MPTVSDQDMEEAAALAAATPATTEPPKPPQVLEHVSNSLAQFKRAEIEAGGYSLVIAVLETELRGAEQKVNDEIVRIETEAADRIARLRENFVVDQTRLNARLDDLRESREMLEAQMQAYRSRHPPQEETRAETNTKSDPAGTREEDAGRT